MIRPSTSRFRAIAHTATHKVLSNNISINIRATAQRYDVLATTVLIQTAWTVVLGKHTATDDVVFGATLSGRNTSINGIDRHYDWADTYYGAVSSAMGRSCVYQPTFAAANISAIGPNEKNACWFCTLLVVQPGKAEITHLEDFLQADNSSGTDIVRTYPITVEFTLSGKNMSSAEVKLHYDESLLTEEMAEWVLHYLESTLNYIGLADLGTPVSDIEITGSAERQLFVSHAQKCAEKIDRNTAAFALKVGNVQKTRLDLLSIALACYLQHVYNIGSEQIIPIGFKKSALAIIAILGVLNAGAAYVSLDTSQPAQHPQRILKQLKPTHALCSEKTYSKMQRIIDNPTQISDAWLSHIHSSITDLPPGLKYYASTADNAIAFFTSGSTEQPKCVASRHSAVSTSMYHTAKFFRLEAGARVF
ncbi:hypothetical protein EKO27_g5478 [Xylaria grammica]|uniref:AMP-dependent synthetase/ligase domain-containing protein n=1 Tax=Xylaria grammica TaxID=363999 RepID=A0A439D5E2_9PEZI|nr:hypothetical protein EKO27_g5478 [Xylaria grammica]